jgi:hypothetical protein
MSRFWNWFLTSGWHWVWLSAQIIAVLVALIQGVFLAVNWSRRLRNWWALFHFFTRYGVLSPGEYVEEHWFFWAGMAANGGVAVCLGWIRKRLELPKVELTTTLQRGLQRNSTGAVVRCG